MEDLCANMDILLAGLDLCHVFELKGNLTDSAVQKTGETGDIYFFQSSYFSHDPFNSFFSKTFCIETFFYRKTTFCIKTF